MEKHKSLWQSLAPIWRTFGISIVPSGTKATKALVHHLLLPPVPSGSRHGQGQALRDVLHPKIQIRNPLGQRLINIDQTDLWDFICMQVCTLYSLYTLIVLPCARMQRKKAVLLSKHVLALLKMLRPEMARNSQNLWAWQGLPLRFATEIPKLKNQGPKVTNF